MFDCAEATALRFACAKYRMKCSEARRQFGKMTLSSITRIFITHMQCVAALVRAADSAALITRSAFAGSSLALTSSRAMTGCVIPRTVR